MYLFGKEINDETYAICKSDMMIKGNNPEATNTITEPEKIIPVTSKIKGVAATFKRILEPYSVTMLQLQMAK